MTKPYFTRPSAAAAAVIIPVHGQPGFMIEAIESALAQTISVEIVIVDDGCPCPETAILVASYAVAYCNVTALQQCNSGLSAARNRGITYVLNHWPSIEAIYFLDADNRLSPATIESSLAIMRSSKYIDWIYPDIDRFGIASSSSHAGTYSPLLQIAFENICEAGSLVSRRVLEAGIRFDESLREGCEDWDFWLQAHEKGFSGQHHPAAGFEYRRRAESLIGTTKRAYQRVSQQVRARHSALYNYDTLMALEHQQSPRFCRICPQSGAGVGFSDPSAEGRQWSAAELRDLIEAESTEPDHCGPPPQLLWMSEAAFAMIGSLRIGWTLFNIVERYLAYFDFVAIEIEPHFGQLGFAFTACEGAWLARETLHGAAFTGTQLRGWARTGGGAPSIPADAKGMRLTLRGPVDRTACDLAQFGLARLLVDWLAVLSEAPRQRWNWRAPHLPVIAQRSKLLEKCLGIEQAQCRVRCDRRPQVAIVLPFVAFGGVERVAFAVARALAAIGCNVHLFVVGQTAIPLRPKEKLAFASINMLCEPHFAFHGGQSLYLGERVTLEGDEHAMTPRLLGLLAGMDVVINNHVLTLNATAAALRERGTRFVSHLHVIDETAHGRPCGLVHGALAFEHAHDAYLTCSDHLSNWLRAMGVPSSKIVSLPNAPGVAAPKMLARSITPPDDPLRVLFLGRLDRQKGIERLIGIVANCRRRGLPLRWRVIGTAVVDREVSAIWQEELNALGVEIESPILCADALGDALVQSDILVMPSRWEGAPLTILEAQQAGCVPIASDVGALRELINDNRDGILISDGDDIAVIAGFVDQLAALSQNRADLTALSSRAQAAAAQWNWADSCGGLVRLIESWFPMTLPPEAPSV